MNTNLSTDSVNNSRDNCGACHEVAMNPGTTGSLGDLEPHAAIRAALDAVPCVKWTASRATVHIPETEDWAGKDLSITGLDKQVARKLARYIADTNPAAIRALLAERDALREALQQSARVIALDRESLFETHLDPKTGQVEDRLGREGLAEYDAALAAAKAALAQEQP